MAHYLQTAYSDSRNLHNILLEYNSKPYLMANTYFAAFIIFSFTKKLPKKLICILYQLHSHR